MVEIILQCNIYQIAKMYTLIFYNFLSIKLLKGKRINQSNWSLGTQVPKEWFRMMAVFCCCLLIWFVFLPNSMYQKAQSGKKVFYFPLFTDHFPLTLLVSKRHHSQPLLGTVTGGTRGPAPSFTECMSI